MRFATLMLALPLVACGSLANNDEGRSATVDRTFPVNGFDRISNSAPVSIEVRTGGSFAVRASGDQKLVERLEVAVSNGTLRIGTRKDSSWNWRGDSGSTRITVTMPEIHGAAIAGAGDMTIDRGSGDFTGDISGAGNMTVGEMRGGNVSLSISGAGNMGLAGVAENLKVRVVGTGSIEAKELRARSAEVSVSGAGSVDATVDGDAKVSISGIGSVDLGSRARCQIRKSGVGSVTCGG